MKPQAKEKLRGVRISGSFGPGVVVESCGSTAINVAGGIDSGDVYHVVDRTESLGFDKVRERAAKLELPPDQKARLLEALDSIEKELPRDQEANLGLIEMLLSGIRDLAPQILSPLAQAMVEQTNNQAILSLARPFLAK